MNRLEVVKLSRCFGPVTALHEISFSVEPGEFVTLLGPSGCGKSTTLAAMAGLDRPTSGIIRIGDRPVFDHERNIFVDAQFRDVGLMFQNYALWPHMTVAQNLGFTLELRRIRGAEAKSRIRDALALVDMEVFADRYPAELSGGQQQRAALARTIVYRPHVLLLDEPLANLDAKLRDRARIWLRDLQRRMGMTTVYVTHDQSEALALSDRIVVMNRGRIAQIGTPQDIYEKPADSFVADFVGASNLLEGEFVPASSGSCRVRLSCGHTVEVNEKAPAGAQGRVLVAIRPERVLLADGADPKRSVNSIPAEVMGTTYQGSRNVHMVAIGNQQVRIENNGRPTRTSVLVHFPPDALHVFPAPAEGNQAYAAC